MTIINEQSVLIQKYIREGLTPAQAHAKARDVLEIVSELRDRCPDLTDAQRLHDAELEATVGEKAMRDHLGRVNKLTITPTDKGLRLQRGEKGLLLSGHEIAALLDQSRRYLAAERKAEGRADIHARRQAEGRAPFRVVGGRLANEQAA